MGKKEGGLMNQNSQTNVLAILEQVGALITEDHLVYTSGRHGSSYVNKDALYPHTSETSLVCREIAIRFAHEPIEVVAGPAIGGVILAQWVAHHLSLLRGEAVLAAYAEASSPHGASSGGRHTFRRGYGELVAGKRVLVVDDVLTTGGSARSVVTAVREQGGIVIGLGAICNRGNLSAESLTVPILCSLVNLSWESWEAHECPLCQRGIPINPRLGKGTTSPKP